MATVKYATFGNVAYDLNRSTEAYVDVPVERPEYKPEVDKKTRTKTRAHAVSAVSVVSAVAIILAIVLIVLNLLSYAMLAEISKVTTRAESKYLTLQQEKAKLLVKYEQTFNMNEVEDYAINVMGMTRPTASQKVQVETTRSDKAVVYTYEKEDAGNFVTDMANFISSLFAYFK